MPMEIVNPLNKPQWNELIRVGTGSSVFNSSNWARVLSESYGYEPRYFSIMERGRLSAMVPIMDVRSLLTGRRGVSLPFTDYCEPIFLDDGYRKVSMEFVKNYGKKHGWKYIELRGDDYFANGMICFNSYLGHALDISGDWEGIISGMRGSTKKNVRKALRMGVRTEMSTSLDSLGEYYRLHCLTRRRHGLPPQPFLFFRKIHEHLISKGLGMVALASYGGRYVAGGVFFQFGNCAVYKYSAMDLRYQEVRPNNLIVWEALRYYAERGYKTFCMGRTELDAAGLRQYKNGWGAREHIIRYFRYDPENGRYDVDYSPIRGVIHGVVNGMPLPLLRMAGKLLYRHAG